MAFESFVILDSERHRAHSSCEFVLKYKPVMLCGNAVRPCKHLCNITAARQFAANVVARHEYVCSTVMAGTAKYSGSSYFSHGRIGLPRFLPGEVIVKISQQHRGRVRHAGSDFRVSMLRLHVLPCKSARFAFFVNR